METAGWSPPLPEGRGRRAPAGYHLPKKEAVKEGLKQTQLPALLRPPETRGLTMTMAVSRTHMKLLPA